MKHLSRHYFAILPLLSVLSLSPSQMDVKYSNHRSIASVEIKDAPAEKVEVKTEEPKKEEPKKEETSVAVNEPKKEEPKKEEPAKEEPKKEEASVAADEAKKDEPKKEEAKKEVCAAEEQNKLLTAQIQDLMKQQNQILQAMINMTNMMTSMYQQQQQPNPFYSNGPGWQSSPYQYNQPTVAGNWVYYPTGFQPQQQNIFANPQPTQQGFYPDQVHGSSWGLQPSYNLRASAVEPQGAVAPPASASVAPGSFNMTPSSATYF